MENIISLQHAAMVYHSPQDMLEAVHDVSFTVAQGEFVSLIGPSGCGKSTLLSVLAGLEQLSGGEACVCGEPIHGTSQHIGLMPQRDGLFDWLTVYRNVCLGLQLRHETDETHLGYVEDLLSRYGLREFSGKRPSELSGGMRQRCALIRTLATKPDILLLDEPFSALDYQTRLLVSGDVYHILRQEKKTALLVTHDIAEAVSMADRIIILSPRPATVRTIVDMGELKDLPPLKRREMPQFSAYFDRVWRLLRGDG